MLWLTEVKQAGADVVIDGNSTTQTGVSDFVTNLETSGYFKQVDRHRRHEDRAARDSRRASWCQFTLRAQFQTPGERSRRPRPQRR